MIRSLKDRCVTIVSLTHNVWLVFGLLYNIRESATPDSKENKQADRQLSFPKAFSVRRVVNFFICRA